MNMKLFAVTDHAEWDGQDGVDIVLAHDAEEARRLACNETGSVFEIPLDEPMHVMRRPEPDWDSDW